MASMRASLVARFIEVEPGGPPTALSAIMSSWEPRLDANGFGSTDSPCRPEFHCCRGPRSSLIPDMLSCSPRVRWLSVCLRRTSPVHEAGASGAVPCGQGAGPGQGEAIHARLDRLQEHLAQAQRQTREQLHYLRADYADWREVFALEDERKQRLAAKRPVLESWKCAAGAGKASRGRAERRA